MKRALLTILGCSSLLLLNEARAQALPSTVDICMLQDVGAGVLRVSLRANDQDFGQVLSGLVFTIRWPESSTATLSVGSSAWCPPSQAFQPGPSATVAPGNGYKYKTWTSTGFQLLSEIFDNSGCEQTLLADTWTEVLVIPISNDPLVTFFELVNDDYTALPEVNRNFFVSLNGEQLNDIGDPLTGTTCSQSTRVPVTALSDVPFTITPNPTTGDLLFTLSDASEAEGIVISDATGREVLRTMFRPVNGPIRQHIDLRDQAPGAYVLRFLAKDRSYTRTIILQR